MDDENAAWDSKSRILYKEVSKNRRNDLSFSTSLIIKKNIKKGLDVGCGSGYLYQFW